MLNLDIALYYLNIDKEKYCNSEDSKKLASELIDNPKFQVWSGSSKKEQHHYGRSGLIIHTAEVVSLCFSSISVIDVEIDKEELFLSALYHDAGKLYDYSPIDGTNYREWEGAEHKRLIHHISRSALIWSDEVRKYPELERKHRDNVLHNILSHHGRREWGSPVAPKSKAAWILHLNDCLSARLNDCDKLDVF